MISKHSFFININWPLNAPPLNEANNKTSLKSHNISIEGKADLWISAAKAFKGDPSLHNPEDLLLSSLASCHMMSYLYVCQQNKIEVISYSDHAEAILEVNSDGSGYIKKVILKPKVTIKSLEYKELALSLHIKANKLCFIANSCNFEIIHHPEVQVLNSL